MRLKFFERVRALFVCFGNISRSVFGSEDGTEKKTESFTVNWISKGKTTHSSYESALRVVPEKWIIFGMNASGFSRQAAHSTESSLLHSATRMRNSQPENEVETIELSFSCNWAQFTRLFRCQQTEIKTTNSAVAKDKVFRPTRPSLLPIRLQNFLIYIETSNSLSKCLDKGAVLLGIKIKPQGYSHNMWRCFESVRKYPLDSA